MIRTLAAALATTTCIVALATPAAAQTREYNIPAGSLKSALDAYVRQSGRQVVYRADEVRSARSPGVRGSLSSEAALAALLAGSGFTTRVDGNLIAIVKAGNGNAASSPASPGQASPAAGEPGSNFGEEYTGSTSEVIVVTGTNIRGAQPVGAQLVTIDRSDFQRSGATTLQDMTRLVPQLFAGGVSETNNSDSRASNFNRGTAFNLRGLGPDATLVLVNGVRQASGGTAGAFVDISSIPLSAIERVEVLPDSASAIYGSDAIGGVINVILRQGFHGSETSAQFSTFDGDSPAYRLSQVFGHSIGNLDLLVGAQYQERERLARSERPFTATDDLSLFGGTDFRTFNSNPANILDLTTRVPIAGVPTGQNGTGLTRAKLTSTLNRNDTGGQADLLPSQQNISVFGSANGDLGSNIEISATGRYNHRKVEFDAAGATASFLVPTFNPYWFDAYGTGQPVRIGYSFFDDLGPVHSRGEIDSLAFSIGGSAELSSTWTARVNASWVQEKSDTTVSNLLNFNGLIASLTNSNPESALNPFGDGSFTNPTTLDTLRAVQTERSKSRIYGAGLTLDGTVLQLPSGPLKVAFGGEVFHSSLNSIETLTDSVPTSLGVGRDVAAAFAEVRAELLPHLDASAAVRYEHYSDFGSTANPRLGLAWSPTRVLSVFGNWGTSFKAPRLSDLAVSPANTFDLFFTLPDPRSPSGSSNVLLRRGNNPRLDEETAQTWTVGLELKPATDMLLRASYFNIDYEGRIQVPGPSANLNSILLQEDLWSSVITRNPARTQIDAICRAPTFVGDVNDCLQTTPAAIVDQRLTNLASLEAQGLDVTASVRRPAFGGDLTLQFQGTLFTSLKRRFTDASPSEQLAGQLGNPARFRSRSTVEWSQDGASASLSWNHVSGAQDLTGTTPLTVEPWDTFDLSLRLARSGWSGLSVSAVVNNMFDRRPPFANVFQRGYDSANADPYGRTLSIQLTKAW